jgi:nucleoid-associated protein YgaU
MDTKARIGLFVGGLVLVGMVAYVMMPRSAEPKADDALTAAQTPSDSVDYAAAPSTQPAPATQPIAITDPFAAPAPTPAMADAGTGASVSTLGQPSPAPEQTAAQPTSGDDAWGRALDGGTTQTRSVGGSLSSHSSLLAEAGTLSTPASPKTYKVEAGDSPFTISQKLFGDGKYASKIMAANPGVNARRLKVGQELTIPDITAKETAPGSSVAGTADHTDPVPVAGASASAKTYKVQAGDTLSGISSKLYGKSSMWKQLYAANKSKIGADPTRLRAGMVLQVPDNVQ